MYAKFFMVAATLAAMLFTTAAQATPRIQNWQASSGARVYFVENHDLPLLDVAVSFAAGSRYDTAQSSGVAGLTHDHDTAFATAPGHRCHTTQAPQSVIVSLPQGPPGLGEQRGEDDPPDSRQGP